MLPTTLIGSLLVFHLTLLSAPELKRQVSPSVFRLSVQLVTGASSSGTGFLISRSGLMVTNNHVIEGARQIVAEDDDRLAIPVKPGFYVRDPFHDLAIIQLDLERAPAGFEPVPLPLAEDTAELDGGYEVYVLGHPEGVKIAEFTRGDLTAVEPEPRRLRFDASIHNGSSGSPMFDARTGEVIGVVTSFWTGGRELNYATPVEYLHDLRARLGESPTLLPFRTPANRGGVLAGGGALSLNLIVSLLFFVGLVFGVRRLLRSAGH